MLPTNRIIGKRDVFDLNKIRETGMKETSHKKVVIHFIRGMAHTFKGQPLYKTAHFIWRDPKQESKLESVRRNQEFHENLTASTTKILNTPIPNPPKPKQEL